MKPRLRPYYDQIIIGILAILCYVFFFYALGGIGFIGPDEPRYASIAREMLVSGDYVTPRLFGSAWFEKPPLMYWFAAAGYKIFGMNEAGARFASALGATICVFLVYWCGRKLWDRATGFVAAYTDSQVRKTVQSQLQGMADRGATFIHTSMWVAKQPGQTCCSNAQITFPMTDPEAANLRTYAQDVASIQSAAGNRLGSTWRSCGVERRTIPSDRLRPA